MEGAAEAGMRRKGTEHEIWTKRALIKPPLPRSVRHSYTLGHYYLTVLGHLPLYM